MDPYADFSGSGTLTARYLYGLAADALFARLDASGNTAWYLTDLLGSVRQMVNSSGSVIDQLSYDSYGNVLSESSSANGDRFKWTGRDSDSEVHLQYNRNRYYDPTIGRWISSDPLGFLAGDSNLFRYVWNQSNEFVDPSGRMTGAQGGALAGQGIGALCGAAGATTGLIILLGASNPVGWTVLGVVALGALAGSCVGTMIGYQAGLPHPNGGAGASAVISSPGVYASTFVAGLSIVSFNKSAILDKLKPLRPPVVPPAAP
jgi:RHS repeat-associated protein